MLHTALIIKHSRFILTSRRADCKTNVPPQRWHTVTTDYITGLPEIDNAHDAIAVFIDKLSRCVHLMARTTPAMVKTGLTCSLAAFMHIKVYLRASCLTEDLNLGANHTLATRSGITWDLGSPDIPSPIGNGMTELTIHAVEGMLGISPKM